MNDDVVMRSAYLTLSEDKDLGELARKHNVSKSDLIQAAVTSQLDTWLKTGPDQIKNDLASVKDSRSNQANHTTVPET